MTNILYIYFISIVFGAGQSVQKMCGIVKPDVRSLFTSNPSLMLDRRLCFLVMCWLGFRDLHSSIFFCLNFCFMACCPQFFFVVFLFLRPLQMRHFFQLLELLEVGTEQHLKQIKTLCGYSRQTVWHDRKSWTDTGQTHGQTLTWL